MAKTNPWLVHLARFRKEHPKVPFLKAAKEAKKTYKPVKR